MKPSVLIAAAVAAAASLPMPADAGPAPAPPYKAEKCFGVAAAGQNDCQTATHSCAGESKTAAAGDSWIYVPAGTCMKINGGSPTRKNPDRSNGRRDTVLPRIALIRQRETIMRPISLARSLRAAGTLSYEAASAAGLRRARVFASIVFFANGFVVASWLPHIPEVKERLGLGDFLLGIALFSMAVGSVLVLPLAGWSAGRFGSDATTRTAGLALCLLLPAPVMAPDLVTLILALLLFGAANGMLDVSMNAQAVLIEDRYRRPILSSLHGLYSTGGLAGASLVAAAASIGIPAPVQTLGLTVVLMPLLLAISRYLLHGDARGRDRGAVLAWPSRALLGLGALAFLALMAEGAMGDWAAVFLREYRRAGMDGAATGFAGFSLAMAAGRFAGDWVRRRWGAPTLLRAGGLAAAVGMTTALTVQGLVPSVLGFTLFGLGLANMIPLLFGAAGRARGMTPGLGIAAVATTGYTGLLAGPPLIGMTAELVGLRLALVAIVCGVLAIAVFAGVVPDKTAGSPTSVD